MNLKVLFILFLCLSSICMAYNVTMGTLNRPLVRSRVDREAVSMGHLVLGGDGNEPEGDPRGGGGLPS